MAEIMVPPDEGIPGVDNRLDWEHGLRLGSADHGKRLSMHASQHKPDDVKCDITLYDRHEQQYNLSGDHDTYTVRFSVGGGTDCPFWQISLRMWVGRNKTGRFLDMWARWYAWTEVDENARHPTMRETRFYNPFSVNHPTTSGGVGENFGTMILRASYMLMDGETPTDVAWEWDRGPYLYHTAADTTPYAQEARDAASILKLLGSNRGYVNVKLHPGRLIPEALKMFYAQPVPAPRTWWRYAIAPRQQASIIEDFPPVDLTMYTRRRSNWFELPDRGFDAQASIVPMAKRLFFVTNREYEVFMVGCIMRDADEESLQYDTFFNGVYRESAVEPATKYLPHCTAHSYFVFLRVKLSAAAHEAHASVPDENTECVVTVNKETWPGVVVTIPKGIDEWTYNCAIHAFRATPATGLVVGENSHTVRVRFGPRGHPTASSRRAVRWLIHGERSRHINTVALRHQIFDLGNRSLETQDTLAWEDRTIAEDIIKELRLNVAQSQAIDLLFEPRGDLGLVWGPPGTGKTSLIVAAATICLELGRPLLLCAASNTAANVIIRKLEETLRKTGRTHLLSNIYRFFKPSIEDYRGEDDEPEDDDDAVPTTPRPDALKPYIDPSVVSYDHRVVKGLQIILKSEDPAAKVGFSLRQKIMGKVEALACGDNLGVPENEYAVLVGVHEALEELHTPLPDDTVDPLEAEQRRVELVRKAWLQAQKYYLSCASVVVCTCAAIGSKAISVAFHPSHVIVDEAAQCKEYECLLPLVLVKGRVRSSLLIGDHQQLRPITKTEKRSEFAEQAVLSLFERLFVNENTPRVSLNVQYRMVPDIVMHPNRVFYRGTLTSDESTRNRPLANKFRQWGKALRPHLDDRRGWVASNSIFISVENGTLRKQVNGTSKANLAQVGLCARVVINLLRTFKSDQLRCFCYYKAAVHVLGQTLQRLATIPKFERLMLQDVPVATVDSAQGDEADIVILDLSTPGGKDFPLGFVRQPQRQNMALTRARNGLVVLGNERMAESQFSGAGVTAWKEFTAQHKKHGWIWYANAETVLNGAEEVREVVGGFENDFIRVTETEVADAQAPT